MSGHLHMPLLPRRIFVSRVLKNAPDRRPHPECWPPSYHCDQLLVAMGGIGW